MLGRTDRPVPGGGGRPGDTVSVVADLGGGWRPGYGGRQWDSTTVRPAGDLRRLAGTLARPAVRRPRRAAKDVSMAGIVGTLAMLAEASGCGAELDVASIPRPPGVRLADWLTCFPGFALVTAGEPLDPADVAPATDRGLRPPRARRRRDAALARRRADRRPCPPGRWSASARPARPPARCPTP